MKLDWKEKILIQGEKPPENPLEEEFIASLGDPVESLSWTWNGDHSVDLTINAIARRVVRQFPIV